MTAILEAPVRDPLLDEMQQAGRQALHETDPLRRSFFTGLFNGYAVGFGLIDRKVLDRARLMPGALNLHIDFRKPRPFDDEDTLWACGVRHGYYLATSERPDADLCGLCGDRITDADDSEDCDHGRFCDGSGCISDWHIPGGGYGLCTYIDGRNADGGL